MSENFLPDITQDVIDERTVKIKSFLEEEKQTILQDLNHRINQFLTKKKNNRPENTDETYECFKLFYVACQNLLSVYFPMIMDEEYLSLQSENQIMEKVNELKQTITKNLKLLHEKSLMTGDDWKKQFQRRQKTQNAPKRGRNSKTPLECTEVLIRWLLANFKNPYPSNLEKEQLAKESNLQLAQVNNWFINARQRVIKKYLKKEIKQSGKYEVESES